MHSFGFQNLEVYQLAKNLVIQSYCFTKRFPDAEKYALIQQINRAIISVPSNIAEGYSRASPKEKSHFLNISYGSLMEVVCQYEIAHSLGYITVNQFEDMIKQARDLAVRVSNFRAYVDRNR